MAQNYEILPLYSDPDYYYVVSLQGIAYKIRFYYNERVARWCMDLSYADGTPIVLGESLVRNFPMFLDYHIEGLTGYFFLEEVGKNINETNNNPYEVWKYFRLYYIYESGE